MLPGVAALRKRARNEPLTDEERRLFAAASRKPSEPSVPHAQVLKPSSPSISAARTGFVNGLAAGEVLEEGAVRALLQVAPVTQDLSVAAPGFSAVLDRLDVIDVEVAEA